jgi:serine/threonine protein kinase
VTETGGGGERDESTGSVEIDSFVRAVARAPRVSPRSVKEPDLVGRTLLHFHVVERLGAGGMGVVYKAVDEKLRRNVALKVLSARLRASDRHRETLLREARSTAAVSHSNIASIHEVHETPEATFFVMELVEGDTLRVRLSRGGALPPPEVLRVALGIARGLARAHASGVVHRDLKCDNVMLTRDGDVKLLDFGLATLQGESHNADPQAASDPEPLALAPTMPATATPTTGGLVAGTPASMSPEQAHGEAVDARTDVYAFGVVLYEMLSGKVPFPHRRRHPWEWGDEESEAWKPHRALREVAPRVPRDLEQLVVQCLAYARDVRPRDGAALVARIEACRVPRSHRGFVLAGAMGVTIAVAAAIAWGARRQRAAEQPTIPTVLTVASAASSRASEPVLRALTTDSSGSHLERSWQPFNVSDDTQRLLYMGSGKYRVRDLRNDTDEVFSSPDETRVAAAMFRGVGAAERILVQTMRASWSIDPTTKQATKIVDDPLSCSSMSDDGRYFEWLRTDKKRTVAVFGRTDTTTGVATELGDIDDVGDPPVFVLSPNGSLLARSVGGKPMRLAVARSDTPLDVHDIVVDDRLRIRWNSMSFAWLADDRLVVALQEGDPPTTNLWQIRIDPAELRPIGPPEQVTHWDHVIARLLQVHASRHSISFMRDDVQGDVSIAKLAPRTRRLSAPHRLTQSETDERPGVWTADGKDLVFMSNRAGRWAIYVRGLDDASLERPVVTGPVSSSWPQVVLGDTAILYWSVPTDAPASLMRAPFPAANAPAEVLFASADRERWTWGAPLPVMSRFVCARQTPDCVLLSYDSTSSAWTWYHLDPRDGARRPIEGLPAPNYLGPNLSISPDGKRLALEDADQNVCVYEIASTVHLLSKSPRAYLRAFDADSRGVFLSFVHSIGWAPALSYLWDDGRQSEVLRPDIFDPVDAPAVSPDGSQMAVLSQTETWNLWLAEDAF